MNPHSPPSSGRLWSSARKESRSGSQETIPPSSRGKRKTFEDVPGSLWKAVSEQKKLEQWWGCYQTWQSTTSFPLTQSTDFLLVLCVLMADWWRRQGRYWHSHLLHISWDSAELRVLPRATQFRDKAITFVVPWQLLQWKSSVSHVFSRVRQKTLESCRNNKDWTRPKREHAGDCPPPQDDGVDESVLPTLESSVYPQFSTWHSVSFLLTAPTELQLYPKLNTQNRKWSPKAKATSVCDDRQTLCPVAQGHRY